MALKFNPEQEQRLKHMGDALTVSFMRVDMTTGDSVINHIRTFMNDNFKNSLKKFIEDANILSGKDIQELSDLFIKRYMDPILSDYKKTHRDQYNHIQKMVNDEFRTVYQSLVLKLAQEVPPSPSTPRTPRSESASPTPSSLESEEEEMDLEAFLGPRRVEPPKSKEEKVIFTKVERDALKSLASLVGKLKSDGFNLGSMLQSLVGKSKKEEELDDIKNQQKPLAEALYQRLLPFTLDESRQPTITMPKRLKDELIELLKNTLQEDRELFNAPNAPQTSAFSIAILNTLDKLQPNPRFSQTDENPWRNSPENRTSIRPR